jgi:3-hydroxyisobutyrate dehydrogenase
MAKAGFVGLGRMGGSMALNLAQGGHDVMVHDLHRSTAERHEAAGATWADSARALAEQCDVLFTSLPGPKDVEAVALGDDGFYPAIRAGHVYFDLSTNSPEVVRAIHARYQEKGAHMLDAPVSGGPQGAESGKLAIWVGGEAEVYDAHESVLRSIGDEPYYCGPIGAGSIAKLVHNCTGYMLQTALAETFSMGVKAGLDPLPLWQAVRQGAIGRRRTFDGLSRQFLPNRYDPADFALELATKDVTLAVELGRQYGVPMRLANLTLQEMTEAMNRGWAQRDSRSAMLLQTERAGVTVEADPEAIQSELKK